MLETHKRRQIILSLLRESGMLDVDEVAARLVVSPNTIRNDFNALAAEGLLRRIRGGAALAEPPAGEQGASNPPFLARCTINHPAKKQMARWAAGLVEDGDSIVLDASSTIYHLAGFLMERRNLTIITNGIEVGRKLAQNPSNTVMLLGGLLRENGIPTADVLSDPILKDLHVRLAFVSCRAFTPAAGLTEADILDAQLKARMVAAASSVIALIDASKFGKVGLAPFARVDQVAHIFTDSRLSHEWVEQLRNSGVKLTVCDEGAISVYAPCESKGLASHGQPMLAGDQRVAPLPDRFATFPNEMPFAGAGAPWGSKRPSHLGGAPAKNVELLIRDNDLDRRPRPGECGLFIDQQVDLVIESRSTQKAGNIIMRRFRAAAFPSSQLTSPARRDLLRRRQLSGRPPGRRRPRPLDRGALDRTLDLLLCLVDPRAGSVPAARLQGGRDGLEAVLGPIPNERVITLPCPTLMYEAQASIAAQLPNILAHAERAASDATAASDAHHLPSSIFHLPSGAPARIAIIAHNDDAALGALSAFEGAAGASVMVAAVGQNADRLGRAAMEPTQLTRVSHLQASGFQLPSQRPGPIPKAWSEPEDLAPPAFIGSTSYAPETYGVRLIDLALKILAGEPVPPPSISTTRSFPRKGPCHDSTLPPSAASAAYAAGAASASNGNAPYLQALRRHGGPGRRLPRPPRRRSPCPHRRERRG